MPADLDELLDRARKASAAEVLPTREELMARLQSYLARAENPATDELDRQVALLGVDVVTTKLEHGRYRRDARPALRSIAGGRDNTD